MIVIGTGLPRTATTAQKVALEQIMGIGPCYHMVDIWEDLDRVPDWVDAFEGRADWAKIFDGYRAAVDWPASYYWRDLVEFYPDAKVLLSVRDGESWARSMHSTIWGALYGDTLMRDLSCARAKVDPRWHQYRTLMKSMWRKSGLLGPDEEVFNIQAMAAAMERHNEEVRETVPPERLLIWSPPDGMGPLFEFLELPVQDVPVPQVNNDVGFVGNTIAASLGTLNAWQAGREAQSEQLRTEERPSQGRTHRADTADLPVEPSVCARIENGSDLLISKGHDADFSS